MKRELDAVGMAGACRSSGPEPNLECGSCRRRYFTAALGMVLDRPHCAACGGTLTLRSERCEPVAG